MDTPTRQARRALTMLCLVLAVLNAGCAALNVRFGDDKDRLGPEYDYFAPSFKPSRYYIGTHDAFDGRGPLTPDKKLPPRGADPGYIWLAAPLILIGTPVVIAVDTAASVVVDTLLLPLDYSLEQRDRAPESPTQENKPPAGATSP